MAAAVDHAASRTNAPRHIIMFNIPFGRAAKNKDGARTFSNITLPRLERYAGLVGATLRVIRNRTEVSITPEVRSAWTRSPAGRGNSTIYVLKLLAVGQALQQLARNGGGAQARVLLIDDSVFITPNASDVFRVCHPEAAVCGFSEGTSPVPEMATTFARARAWLSGKGVRALASIYFNTGAIVFGQGARELLSSSRIAEGMRYFGSGHPSQDYLCARLSASSFRERTHAIPRTFNYVPSARQQIKQNGVTRLNLDRLGLADFYHITSGVPQRTNVLQQLAERFPLKIPRGEGSGEGSGEGRGGTVSSWARRWRGRGSNVGSMRYRCATYDSDPARCNAAHSSGVPCVHRNASGRSECRATRTQMARCTDQDRDSVSCIPHLGVRASHT